MADGNTINTSRRFFLLASAAGGGLMLSGCVTPGDTTDGASALAATPSKPTAPLVDVNVFVAISPDGTIRISPMDQAKPRPVDRPKPVRL